MNCPVCGGKLETVKNPYPAEPSNTKASWICRPCRLQVYIWERPRWAL